ncbi:helix-turn-helix domain-containing protein [Jiangella alba]|uniref:HTH-type transcriptional regulator RipA n=1 Tax=Jiangella alba TaxID=561176 RepID=A0A1H5MKE7_9ACTN|nr:AraC family transcriptional regulator [Jiangella alba]SEE89796.1 AraC-type DNA-binding protein [Jiangella alba]
MSGIRHVPVAPTETRHLSAGDEVTPHRHDDHQLICASSGVLEVIVADGTWYTPSVRAVWVPGGTIHHWQVHGATTVHLVGVPAGLMPPAGHVPSLVPVSPLVRELMIACSRNGPATTPAARRLLRVLVDHVEPAPEPPTMLPVLRDPRLRDVQAVIEADLTTSPALAALGRRVGASERTLSRLFHDEVGMSFAVWRHQLRLHRAVLMLARGDTVTRVAAACGYSSASAFITAFRAAFGRTPGALYR